MSANWLDVSKPRINCHFASLYPNCSHKEITSAKKMGNLSIRKAAHLSATGPAPFSASCLLSRKHDCRWRDQATRLEHKLAEGDAQLTKLAERVNEVEHKLALASKQIVGPKSERMPPPDDHFEICSDVAVGRREARVSEVVTDSRTLRRSVSSKRSPVQYKTRSKVAVERATEAWPIQLLDEV